MRKKQYVVTLTVKERSQIAVLAQRFGTYQLVAKVLYGSGLRLSGAFQLQVKDLGSLLTTSLVATLKEIS